MYLKQLTIKNYRKYNSSNNVIKFAHSSWGNGKKLSNIFLKVLHY